MNMKDTILLRVLMFQYVEQEMYVKDSSDLEARLQEQRKAYNEIQ